MTDVRSSARQMHGCSYSSRMPVLVFWGEVLTDVPRVRARQVGALHRSLLL